MKHEEGTFLGANGASLYFQTWLPDDPPVGAVAIVHGLGEHSSRYPTLVSYLVDQGFAVFGFDHRGHGRSPGPRGHVMKFDEFRQDVAAFVDIIRSRIPERPLFLFGHSLGGLIALNYTLHRPDGLHGLIVSAPGLGTDGVSPLLLSIGKVMSRIWPSLTLDNGLDVTGISRDPAEVAAYQKDQLVHSKASARLSTEAVAAIEACFAMADQLKIPLLMTHGDADRITPHDASQRFFDRVTAADKQFISYPGGYHEAHNDLNRDEVVQNIGQWLNNHL